MIETGEDIVCLTPEQYSVFKCICYFDVFRYPLRSSEICDFIGAKMDPGKVQKTLEGLVAQEMIVFSGIYYTLNKKNDILIRRREEAEKRFIKKRRMIRFYSGLIARFPFVEAVCISGSCSKGLLDKAGDVDYFIITRPSRLWLCRTILILFKKVFLFNSKKYFCLNYFIDSSGLVIPDKNIYVATELRTLLPVSNRRLFERFLEANSWTSDYLPNRKGYDPVFLQETRPSRRIVRLIEKVFSAGFGEKADNWCLKLTLNTWKKRFPHFSPEEFELNFRSRKGVSKHHPNGFQNKVMSELDSRLSRVTLHRA